MIELWSYLDDLWEAFITLLEITWLANVILELLMFFLTLSDECIQNCVTNSLINKTILRPFLGCHSVVDESAFINEDSEESQEIEPVFKKA